MHSSSTPETQAVQMVYGCPRNSMSSSVENAHWVGEMWYIHFHHTGMSVLGTRKPEKRLKRTWVPTVRAVPTSVRLTPATTACVHAMLPMANTNTVSTYMRYRCRLGWKPAAQYVSVVKNTMPAAHAGTSMSILAAQYAVSGYSPSLYSRRNSARSSMMAGTKMAVWMLKLTQMAPIMPKRLLMPEPLRGRSFQMEATTRDSTMRLSSRGIRNPFLSRWHGPIRCRSRILSADRNGSGAGPSPPLRPRTLPALCRLAATEAKLVLAMRATCSLPTWEVLHAAASARLESTACSATEESGGMGHPMSAKCRCRACTGAQHAARPSNSSVQASNMANTSAGGWWIVAMMGVRVSRARLRIRRTSPLAVL
mmetsp:Transcript_19710/g.49414  ORF Transcript_19710/g.49414 Transcript_19710/m.49414 type:complete len:367 (-) Transcript_19710:24-1124(-)